MTKPNQKELLSNNEAALDELGCSPQTLRISRCTGKLFGATAPAFIKMGRSVRYRREVLREWISQFEAKTSTEA